MSKRIGRHTCRRNVYGLVALFFALKRHGDRLDGQKHLGFSDDITNGEGKSPTSERDGDVIRRLQRDAAVRRVHNATLGGVDVKDESLTGADIDESSLGDRNQPGTARGLAGSDRG